MVRSQRHSIGCFNAIYSNYSKDKALEGYINACEESYVVWGYAVQLIIKCTDAYNLNIFVEDYDSPGGLSVSFGWNGTESGLKCHWIGG